MDDLISKLQNVLNDEESMKQIQELAGMLSNEAQENRDPPPASPAPEAALPAAGQQTQGAPDFSNLLSKLGGLFSGGEEAVKNNVPSVSPDQRAPAQNTSGSPDLSSLLAGLSGAAGQSQPQGSSQGGFDVGKLLKLQTIMAQANKSDKNVELLLALKPLLKEENQAKIDRLVKIFKLFAVYPALKESGLLGGDLFGLL
ncbi:hypothetical protein [Ruminococcus sp. Marseille-P6503]|uniref:hypothetical protein n=1 Tax=Ruminococcus sp. Marseille-P6503 TaxID=2364796 RepID=UPI000F533511|nr:hypothetical protein [Ruminococcus sp. Marseille-P6503]